jgi:hypothetical protein
MAANKLEIALASAGLIALGVVGALLLRDSPGDDDVQVQRAPGPTGSRTPAVGPGVIASPARHAQVPYAAGAVQGRVRDRVTGATVAAVEVLFAGDGAEVTTTSGADGGFRVELVPGRYAVRAVGERVASLGAVWLAVSPDAEAQHMDVDVVTLGQIEGRVVDAAGEPIVGVAIGHRTALLQRTLTSRDTAPAGEATSGPDGRFAIDVPPGEVTLIASAATRPTATTTLRWVEPGARIGGVEIVMDAGLAVAGVVRDPDGNPVAGARVVGVDDDPASGGFGASAIDGDDGAEPAATVTGPDGRFKLRALATGRVLLSARAAGFAPSRVVSVDLAPERASADGLVRDDLVLTLARPAAITGRVVDAAGNGVLGARVRAQRLMDRAPAATQETGVGGQFELTGLGAGPFAVTAEAPGYAPAKQRGVTAPGQVELVLQAAGSIVGAVTAGGAPLADFTVRLAAYPMGPGTLNLTEEVQRPLRFASIDGTYRIDGLTPGRYNAVFSAPGWAPGERRDISVPSGAAADVTIDLTAGASIAGTVRSAATDAPVAGAAISLSTGSEGPLEYTDAGGAFAVTDIAPGRRSLSIRHPGYVGKLVTGIEVRGGGETSVAVRLEPVAATADEAIEFAGIGAALSIVDRRLIVRDLVPHGPAEVAGLQRGDEVYTIDGVATEGLPFGDAIEAIRGVAGTVVRLGIHRGDTTLVRDVVRATVRFQPGQPLSAPPGDDAPTRP